MLVGKKIGRRALTVSVVVALSAMIAGLFNPMPAQASAAQQVISGSGSVNDDFTDEATLSRYSQYRHSNAVALWQSILYVEGFLTFSSIDCDFGPATQAATVHYQQRYGLTADGNVGPQTWGVASSFLQNYGTIESSSYENVRYQNGDFIDFHRSTSNGYYSLYLPGAGAYVTAWDNYASPYC